MAEYQEAKNRSCNLIPRCRTPVSLISNLTNLSLGSLYVHAPCKKDVSDFYCHSVCRTKSAVHVPDSYICRGRGFNFFPERLCSNFCEYFKSPFSLPKVHPPKWMKYEGLRLCFQAYWQEPIPESPLETYRIHNCNIIYFPEDDTIEVVEPWTFDPGFVQGRIIRRQKIPLPQISDCCTKLRIPEENYTLDHFQVGCEVQLFGKMFYITGVDDSTRNFLNRSGVSVPANMDGPTDPASDCRKEAFLTQFFKGSGVRARPNFEQEKLKKYLNFYRKVLCFGAYWDDRCNVPPSALRKFNVLYHLEDGTLEVREDIPENSGFEPRYKVFLHRNKVQKSCTKPYVTQIGDRDQEIILNVDRLKSSLCNRNCLTFLPDRLNPGDGDGEYITEKDLAIGATINIYGRAFILTDCDLFTQHYYRDNFNISDFTPLVLDEPECCLPQMDPPPHSGIGNEEDTYLNWNKLLFQMKAPHKCVLVCGPFDSKDVLGFAAQLVDCQHRVNSERRFCLQYHMLDGTVSIIERPHPNTGFPAGVFLHRARVKKTQTSPEFIANNGDLPEYIGPDDLFVGSILYINGFKFQIYEANEATLSLMEKYFEYFPHANLQKVMEKVREATGPMPTEQLLGMFALHDSSKAGAICLDIFRQLLLCITQKGLSEHEIMTLERAYRTEPCEPGVDWNTFQSVIQTELRKNHFDKPLMERMEYTFRQLDPCRFGVIDRENLRSVLKGAKVPLDRDLVDFFVDKFPSADDCNRVDYCCILKYMDWELNAVATAKPQALCCVMEWVHPRRPLKIFCVNYRQFLFDLCPNMKCALPSICCPQNDCCPQDCCPQDCCQQDCCPPQDCCDESPCPGPCPGPGENCCQLPDPACFPTLHCNYFDENHILD